MNNELFLQLRTAVCEVAGLPVPQLEPDEHGRLSFHIRLRGHTVAFIYMPAYNNTHVFMHAEFGPMPPLAGDDGWRMLMQSNTLMFGNDSRVFGLASTQQLTCQWTYPIVATTGQELYASVSRYADWANQWHAGHFFDQEARNMAPNSSVPAWTPALAAHT